MAGGRKGVKTAWRGDKKHKKTETSSRRSFNNSGRRSTQRNGGIKASEAGQATTLPPEWMSRLQAGDEPLEEAIESNYNVARVFGLPVRVLDPAVWGQVGSRTMDEDGNKKASQAENGCFE